MTRYIFANIFRFIFLIFLQIFVLNNIQLMGYVNPYLYILFIILLPLETPRWLLLILAFLMGYTIDYFSHTIGINIAATVFIAYLRPKLIHLLIPKLEPSPEVKIGIKHFGFKSFLLYASILTLVHHLSLFYLEIFRLSDFLLTLRRALLSSVFTIVLIILSQYMFYTQKNKV